MYLHSILQSKTLILLKYINGVTVLCRYMKKTRYSPVPVPHTASKAFLTVYSTPKDISAFTSSKGRAEAENPHLYEK